MNRFGIVLSLAIGILPTVLYAAARVTTKDGAVYTGDVTLKGDNYSVVTPYGTINVPQEAVVGIETIGTDKGQSPAAPPAKADASEPPKAPPAAVDMNGPLRLAGSNTIGEDLMPALLEAYAGSKGDKSPDWTTEDADQLSLATKDSNGGAGFAAHLSRKGSATAFEALVGGNADIGMASRQVKKEEAAQLQGIGFGDAFAPGQENVLSLDGLAVLVNKDNALSTLSLAQIADLFSGKVTDWSQLGGKSAPVHIYARDAKSGTFDTFKSLVLGPNKQKLADSAERFESSSELSDKVANDPGGIGFTGFAYVRSAKAVAIRTDCGLTFPPSEFFVRTEEYPLSRRLFLYTPTHATNVETARFVDYALSDAGQDQAAKKGFINLSPAFAPSNYAEKRIAYSVALFPGNPQDLSTFAKLALGSERLSITFRFRSGSFDLDSRSVRDIDRVVGFVKQQSAERPHRVGVIGFSDSRGLASTNKRLSERRADQIATLLRQKGVTVDFVEGFGVNAPVACNTGDEGMEKNRRVEIWLR